MASRCAALARRSWRAPTKASSVDAACSSARSNAVVRAWAWDDVTWWAVMAVMTALLVFEFRKREDVGPDGDGTDVLAGLVAVVVHGVVDQRHDLAGQFCGL